MLNSSSYLYLFKFVLVGSSGVGKSSLLLQLTEKRTKTTHEPTIGNQFGVATIPVSGRNLVRLHVWDTAGQERFKSITKNFFRGTSGALLIYDITDRKTFQDVPSWLKDIRQEGIEEMTIMLIGNKCELVGKRVVSFEEGQEFAEKHGLLFMECSAETDVNVEEAFTYITEKIYQNIKDGVLEPPSEVHGIKVLLEPDQQIQQQTENASTGFCCT